MADKPSEETDPDVTDMAVEIFRIQSRIMGLSVSEMQAEELKMAGRTFEDLVRMGRTKGLVVRYEVTGKLWTAFGQLPDPEVVDD